MDSTFQDSPTIGRTQANSPLPTPSSHAASLRYGIVMGLSFVHLHPRPHLVDWSFFAHFAPFPCSWTSWALFCSARFVGSNPDHRRRRPRVSFGFGSKSRRPPTPAPRRAPRIARAQHSSGVLPGICAVVQRPTRVFDRRVPTILTQSLCPL
jgi:hypothetical protein